MLPEEFLHPFSTLVGSVADLDGQLVDASAGMTMHVERVAIDLPIELDVSVDADGVVTLASAPPTQHVETTYMPVFHRLRMAIGPDGLR